MKCKECEMFNICSKYLINLESESCIFFKPSPFIESAMNLMELMYQKALLKSEELKKERCGICNNLTKCTKIDIVCVNGRCEEYMAKLFDVAKPKFYDKFKEKFAIHFEDDDKLEEILNLYKTTGKFLYQIKTEKMETQRIERQQLYSLVSGLHSPDLINKIAENGRSKNIYNNYVDFTETEVDLFFALAKQNHDDNDIMRLKQFFKQAVNPRLDALNNWLKEHNILKESSSMNRNLVFDQKGVVTSIVADVIKEEYKIEIYPLSTTHNFGMGAGQKVTIQF